MASRNPDTVVKAETKMAENGNVQTNQSPQNHDSNVGVVGGGNSGGGGARGGHQGHGHVSRRGGPGRFGGGRGGGGGTRGGDRDEGHRGDRDGQMKSERDDRRPNRRGFGGNRNMGDQSRNPEDRVGERLIAIGGPTFELPVLDMSEKKFSGRNRLYIGNLSNDISEEEISEMFKPYGESSELFINKEKNFGFIRLDYHANAEKAKRELDGTVRKGRTLKIRFAPNGATIKVRNLTTWISNELLYAAFSVFGEIERCVIIVDDRGKSTGEGIVEFARKPGATSALKRCSEGCFFLTASLRPVIVDIYDQMDIVDGYPEKSLMKKSPEYHQAREVGPRFATPGSFEHEYGTRWKQLHELYKQKEMSLKQELAMEEDKLEAQMKFAKFENETEMLREQLRNREMDRDRQKREWEERERLADEQRLRNEEQMRRQQEEIQMRMNHQEEDMRRRLQENTLFMQAHQLTNMLDQQEQTMQSYNSPNENTQHADYDLAGGDSSTQNNPMDPKSFMNSYERSHRYEGRGGNNSMGDNMGPGGPPRGSGRWGNDNRRDDYQNKRRRY